PPVEADRADETVPGRRGQPGVAATEAEPHRENGVGTVSEMPYRRPDLRLDPFPRRLPHMAAVLELLSTPGHRGAPAEVVDRDRFVPSLGEAECELLVEPVEAADVGQDHDAGGARLVRACGKGGEAVAVRRFEDEVVVRDRGSAYDGDRRLRVRFVAH